MTITSRNNRPDHCLSNRVPPGGSPKGCNIVAEGNALGIGIGKIFALKGQHKKGREIKMPQSLHSLGAHIIFSTKERRPCLDPSIRPKLWAYLSGILQNMECHSITVGGVDDHVHILCNLTKRHASMKVLELLKKDSSKWIKGQQTALREFHWQDGYGLFGVSPSHFEAVRKYVLRQEEHHRRVSFQDEFIRILKKYQVAYDERYLWD